MKPRVYTNQLKAMQNESTGNLQVQVVSKNGMRPIENATIKLSSPSDPSKVLEELKTNSVGQTDIIDLKAPPVEYSLAPSTEQPYSEYDVEISAPDFEPITINGIEILAGQIALQNASLIPLSDKAEPGSYVIGPHTLFGDYPPKIAEAEIKPPKDTGEIVLDKVVVPEYVIVHDGPPTDKTAQNYYVKYKDYIKNVASSEIYSTWPQSTIEANIYAIMSFTLNRVFTEWYRNKGYNFTITSSTAFDHKWIPNRNIFENISVTVDTIFTSYLSRPNVKQPILTQYCDGNRVQCPNWMTKWRMHM
ncbi:hypothetical protein bsdtb5_14380 [Anaeromicropila herbilytica]|uniref:Uncharacterized protein n=1 Tax=Anaeromicropila herbilytica TaxID=2785025 RepID=A0A7R7IDL4_9FIRM|nr:hypothetical protein bsdtb5_14380 [Anaeromicropila herbilytica]